MARVAWSRLIFGLGLVLLGAAMPASPSAGQPMHQPANVFTASQQQSAGLDADLDGRLFTVWASRRQEGGTSGVFGRLFDPLGVPIGDEVHVNQHLPGQQTDPAVAFGDDGDAWVVWASSEEPGERDAIVARRFGPTAGVFGARGDAFVVNGPATAHRSRPAVAISDGRALVLWTTTSAGKRSVVVGRLFDAEGQAVGGAFPIAGDGESGHWLPVVAPQPDGGFVVAWASMAADGTPLGIRGQRFDHDGDRRGAVIEIARGSDEIEPSIDADDHGRFVVAWMSGAAGGGYEVHARRFGADGVPDGGRLVVASGGSGPGAAADWLSGAAVAMTPGGGFVVVFNAEEPSRPGGDGSATTSADVLARRFDAAGDPIGSPFPVTAPGGGRQTLAIGSSARRVVWRGAAGLAAAWSGETGTDRSGVGVSLLGPRGRRSADPVTRLDEAIAARPWPLGQVLSPAAAAPVRNRDWVPGAPDADVPSGGGDPGFVGFQSRGWDPADADVAVGPNQIVVVVNQAIRFYDKDGTLSFDQDISGPGGFWEAEGAGGFVFDPVTVFDRFSQRFIVAATERLGNNTSLLCVAVSDDSDPNGEWNRYRYDLSAVGGNIDFPNLGVDADAIYITTDFFDPPRGNWTHIFRKQAMVDGDPTPVRSIRNHVDVRGHGAVTTYDALAPAQYFATPYVSNSFIQLVAVTDPLGVPQRETFNLPVPGFTDPPDAEQRGSTNRVATVDRRFKHGVYRNGSLWLAHTIGANGTARTRWYEIRMNGWPGGGTPMLRQVGTQNLGPGVHNWFSAIDVDDAGNMALAFNQSSTQQYVSVERAFRLADDPAGTLRPPTRLQLSTSPELGNRWGDYNGLQEDPVDPSVFWSHAMFRTTDWRTWVGRFDVLEAACPADVDGSGEVGFTDVLAILANWGPCPGCGADVDGNGEIGFPDLLAVLSGWGACPGT